MTLIEGVGDEVVHFMVILFVMAVALLAWWSTNARPDRYRTVLVMRSRTPVTVSIRTRTTVSTSSQAGSSAQTTPLQISSTTTRPTDPETPRAGRVIPLQEMDSIVDADMAMLDNNRLHFYRRIDSPNNSQVPVPSTSNSENLEEPEPASNDQIREMDSIVSAMEADVTSGCDFFARSTNGDAASNRAEAKPNGEHKANATSTESNAPEPTDNQIEDNEAAPSNDETDSENSRKKILIKLKYLNDTQKEVEGSLDEPLKDFKSRHFSAELSSARRVRLIFNGRVLGDEGATLRACGLHHRAVVHCLVHPSAPRPHQQRVTTEEASSNATHELFTEPAPPERSWDLENILMTLVSIALTVVWFFRCEYSNMFTASASVALFGLTLFYSIAIFGLYLSDTFHFERRAVQPVPNN